MAVLSRVLGVAGISSLAGSGEVAIVQKTLSPASVGGATTASQNLAMDAGDANIGDYFLFLSGAEQAGISVAQISAIAAADTLPVVFQNVTAGALTPTAGTYTFLRFRR